MKAKVWWLPWLWTLLALAVVAAVLYWVPGWSLLHVTETYQTFHSDLTTHYLGWAFYRNSAWTLPLGDIQGYFYPLGTNVGYTDSIPLLAVFFKLLDPWLPTDFQYLGWWLGACLWLQLWLSWSLLGRMGVVHPWLRVPSTLLIGVSSIWLFRTMHPALCAHFLLLATIWCYQEQLRGHPWRAWRGQVLTASLAAWVHPYLAVMVLAGVMAGLARQISTVHELRQRWSWVGLALVPPLLVGGSWWLIGYFELSQEQTVSSGLGRYASNLNAWINPAEFSGLLPALSLGIEQYEGYAYLGLGLILLALAWLPLRWIHGSPFQPAAVKAAGQRWGWLIAAMAGLYLFALSPRVHLGNEVLLSYLPTVQDIELFHTFRSTGRFVWLLWYGLVLALLVGWSRLRFSPWLLGSLLWVAVTLQVYDLQPLFKGRHLPPRPAPEEVMQVPAWEQLFAAAEAAVAYPPFRIYYGMNPRPPYLADLARRQQTPITMGYVARAAQEQTDAYSMKLAEKLTHGDLDANHLYLMLPEEAPDLRQAFAQPGISAALLDEYLLIVGPGASPELQQAMQVVQSEQPGKPFFRSLAQFLERYANTDYYVAMAVHDEATFNLGPFNRNYLKARGSDIESLHFRGSYWGIMRRGQVIAEMIDNDDNLALDLCPGDSLVGAPWQCELHLESSGSGKGWRSGIWIKGDQLAGMCRGFNVAVFTAKGEVVDQGCFDTYARPYEVIWEVDSGAP